MRLTLLQPASTTHARQAGWTSCCRRVDRLSVIPSTSRRGTVCHAEEVKKRKAFGEWLLETEDPSQLDQPEEKDFWEGPAFDVIGKSAGFAVPVLVVLLLLVGLFAASSYDSGATAVLKPPTSPEDTAKIFKVE